MAGKAEPLVIVMPARHIRAGSGTRGPGGGPPRDEFAEDFVNHIMPYVESHDRVLTDRSRRAMAGLPMGGGQTLGSGFSHLDKFGYLGVSSPGIFGNGTAAWEEQRQTTLDDASLKDGLKVLCFATGSDDFLIQSTKNAMEVLKKHGFNPRGVHEVVAVDRACAPPPRIRRSDAGGARGSPFRSDTSTAAAKRRKNSSHSRSPLAILPVEIGTVPIRTGGRECPARPAPSCSLVIRVCGLLTGIRRPPATEARHLPGIG